MTFNGWLQIALYCLVIIAITKPFGGYMTRVFAGERTLLSPVLRPVERVLYRLSGVDEAAEQHWTSYAIAMLAFSFAGFVSLYALQRLQGVLPFNPAGPGRGLAGLRVQHLGQLRHQHQLAVLRARNDDELPDPDGGAHGAQLRLGGHRHRAGGRAGARLRPALGADDRQFLGRSDPLRAVHPAADLDRRRPGVRLAGHAAEPQRLYRRRPRWKAPSRSSRRARSPRRR